MKKYIGNLEIKENDNRDFSKLEEVTGYLYVYSNVTLNAPQLTTVGGNLYVYSNVTLPQLTTVGGNLSAYSNGGNLSVYSNVQLPQLTTVGGYLYVYSNVTLNAPQLTTVGGNLSVYSNVQLPQLTTVGGNLYVYSNVTLPQLTTVGGNLYVYSNVTLNAPQLTTVGGNLYVYSNVTLNAPQLTTVGGNLSVYSNVTLNIKFLNKFDYIVADEKVFYIQSKKSSKGIIIYSGFNIKGVKNCKITKHETIYLAYKDDLFAHGETIKKSVEDLNFKIASEKLKNEPIKEDTLITVKHYRLITGACEFGVNEWMKSNNIANSEILAKDLLPLLEKTNAYGLERFKKLITF